MATGGGREEGDINLGRLTIDVGELQARMNQAASMFNQLAANINRSFTGTSWQRFTNAGNQAARAISGSFRAVQPQIDAIRTSIAGVTAAMGGLAVAGVKIGNSYEQSMARVHAVTGATDAEFKKLDATAKQLGIDTVFSAKDAAEGMGFLGLAGFKANEIIKAMPATLDLAAAGQIEVARSADIMAKIMSGMQIPVADLTKVTDILSAAFTNANTDLGQLGEAMKYVGPVGHAAGQSLEQVTATLMVLGNNGYQASMGGTTLRGMLSHLANASKGAEKTFKSLGVTIKDQSGKLRPLADIIDEFNAGLKRTGRTGDTMALAMELFGDRAGPGFAALLAEGGDAIRKYTTLLEKSAGTGKRIADIQMATTQNKFGQLMESIGTLGISFQGRISQQLQDAFQKSNDWLSANANALVDKMEVGWNALVSFSTQAVQAGQKIGAAWIPMLQSLWERATQGYQVFQRWFSALPPGVQGVLKLVAAMTVLSKVVGMGGLVDQIPFVGKLARSLAFLINPLNAVRSAFGVLRALMPAVIALFGFLTSPVGLAVAAIAGLGIGLKMLYDRSEAFRGGVKKVWETIVAFVDAGKATFAEFVAAHQQQFDRIADVSAEIWGKIKTGFTETMDGLGIIIGGALSKLTGGQIKDFQGAWNAVADVADVVLDGFERLLEWFNGDGKGLQSIGISIAKAWNNAMASILESIAGVIDGASKMFYGPVGKMLAKVDPEFARLYMHYAQQDTDILVGATKDAAKSLRAKNVGLDQQQQDIEGQRAKENAARDKAIEEKKRQQAEEEKQKKSQQLAKDEAGLGQRARDERAKQIAALRERDKEAREGRGKEREVKVKAEDETKRLFENASSGALKTNLANQVTAARDKGASGWQLASMRLAARDYEAMVKHAATLDGEERQTMLAAAKEMLASITAMDESVGVSASRFREAATWAGKQRQAFKSRKAADLRTARQKAIDDFKGTNRRPGQSGQDAEKQKGAAMEAGRVDFAQQNAAQEANANQQVAAAQQGMAPRAPVAMTRQAVGAINLTGKQAIQGANKAGATSQQSAALQAQWNEYMSLMLAGKKQESDAAKATFDTMIAAAGKGKAGMADFVKAMAGAEKGADDLAGAEENAAHGKKGHKGGGANGLADAFEAFGKKMEGAFNAVMAPFNAFGQFMQQLMAPWQQAQQAAQQMQQFQQQAAQNFLTNPTGFALQGGEDLNQNLQDAIKSGDPAQIKDAVQKMKDYAQSQINATLHNAANATGDIQNISGFGIHAAGTDQANIAVGLAGNPQAAATVKQFQQQIANLDTLLKKLPNVPKMADGGIVTSPTYAMVGERGPEAVIPLNHLQQWFGNPANIFNGPFGNAMNRFRINPGGMALNAFGLNAGNLGLFDRQFGNASRILNQQLDLGNSGAGAMLANWSKVQQQAEDSLGYARGRREINTGGNAGWSGGAEGAHGFGKELHFNIGNIHLANATDEQIGNLAERLANEVKSRGRDITGRSGFGYSANGRPSPLAPSGQYR